MEGDRRGELPPYPNHSVILQLSSAELPPAPSQQLGRQKGLALPSMGQAGRDEVMGTCGDTRGDPGSGAWAVWPRHRAGRRSGSSSPLLPVDEQESHPEVTVGHPAAALQPQIWGQGTPSHLPAQLITTGVTSPRDAQKEQSPTPRTGAPIQHHPCATPKTHLEGDRTSPAGRF